MLPPSPSQAELQAAAERLNEWNGAQFLEPLFTGNWSPERLALLPAEILPRFTPEQSAALFAAKPDYIALQASRGTGAQEC